MSEEMWPDFVRKARHDAWMDEFDKPEREVEIDAFAEHWGGFGADAFKRALQKGNATERLFAIFALGYLAPPDGEILLIPFLDSPVRKERWASASALGRYKNERAFSLLLGFLMEELEYHAPSLTVGNKPDDPTQKEAWEKELDHQDSEYLEEYNWHMIHRLRITLLLGNWGEPRAIPALAQALRTCVASEFHSAPQSMPHAFSSDWHLFQDHLAYALGQLDAWNALSNVDLPPKRLHIACRYLVFGAFHAHVP